MINDHPGCQIQIIWPFGKEKIWHLLSMSIDTRAAKKDKQKVDKTGQNRLKIRAKMV